MQPSTNYSIIRTLITYSMALVLACLACGQALAEPFHCAPGPDPVHSGSAATSSHPTQEKPNPCSFEGITNSCQMFDPSRGDKIPYKDGTFIPNFSSILEVDQVKSHAEEDKEAKEKYKPIQTRKLNLAVSIRTFVDEISAANNWDLRFQIHLSKNTEIFRALLTGKLYSLEIDSLQLPWPPDKGEEIKRVPLDDIRREVLTKLSPEQMERLQSIVQEQEDLTDTLLDPGSHLDSKTVDEMKEITPERQQRVRELVEFSREKIIGIIQRGRPLSELSQAEKDAIHKIREIRYNDLSDDRIDTNLSCTGVVPNAFYSPREHSINICRRLYNYPDATLVSVLAHEMGHAIDPCLSQFGIFGFDKAKLKTLSQPDSKEPIDEIASDNERYDAFHALNYWSKSIRGETTAYPFAFAMSDSVRQYYEDKGVLVRKTQDTPFSEYVFKDVYECLRSSDGGAFRSLTEDKVREMAKEVVSSRQEIRGADYNPQEDEQRIVSTFMAHPECVGADMSSQMGEAMADWVGAEVMGEFLEGEQLTSDVDRVAPFSFFASLVCMERFKAKKKEEGFVQILEDTLRDYQRTTAPHPGSKSRIEKIYLKNQKVRQALGCQNKEGGSCEIH